MSAIMEKSNNTRASSQEQWSSKQSTGELDIVTGLTDTCTPQKTYNRRYTDDGTDGERNDKPQSKKEKFLNAIETILQRMKTTTLNAKLLQ